MISLASLRKLLRVRKADKFMEYNIQLLRLLLNKVRWKTKINKNKESGKMKIVRLKKINKNRLNRNKVNRMNNGNQKVIRMKKNKLRKVKSYKCQIRKNQK